ncbi:MAG: OsmC family protein [Candidatus Coatesbacteria bacterium]|nr:MAG: OsmC family protein [Candidatus Coatesbacteria bacterium]
MKAEVYMVRGLAFVGKGETNHWLAMDGPPEFGGAAAASRPLELLLIGLAGCTGMDVVSILTKQRLPVEAFSVEVEAPRADEHPKVFTAIHMKYRLRGVGLTDQNVAEAIRLSQEKYCSASAMLSRACPVTFEYEIE